MRAPEQPRGWPRATAPPLTLVISCGSPSSRITASDCTAKASLSSMRRVSPIVRPARLRALFALRARQGHDLLGEAPRVASGHGAAMALRRELVLLTARDGARHLVDVLGR